MKIFSVVELCLTCCRHCNENLKGVISQMDYRMLVAAFTLALQNLCLRHMAASDALAFKNAIRQAKQFTENNVIEEISKAL